MADHIPYSDVEEWLDELPEMVITEVEQVTDRSSKFNFLVKTQRLHINVVQDERNGPLLIGTNAVFDDDLLQAVHENRRQFFAEIESVLTNAPGIFAFTDENGDSVPDEEFTAVALRHWIYPDGATQDSVSSAIIDILGAASYVRDTASRLQEQPDLFR